MIVIPMAGGSSRFFSAGFNRPKYELSAAGHSIFYWTAASFSNYFSSETFLFIARKNFHPRSFIEEECEKLGINQHRIIELEESTRGQAETVWQGLQKAEVDPDEALTIFNIDTIRPHFKLPESVNQWDGYLEVFEGEGDNWSFARPAMAGDTRVIETSEKKPISRLCSTGLYYFSKTEDFYSAFNEAQLSASEFLSKWKEFYIAPLYNHLIEIGKSIHYHQISANDVIFSGTPDEYKKITANTKILNRLQEMREHLKK